jgi:hypothetical protein
MAMGRVAVEGDDFHHDAFSRSCDYFVVVPLTFFPLSSLSLTNNHSKDRFLLI